MRGLIALHGGGEFLPGDEAFLETIVGRAVEAAAVEGRAGRDQPAASDERPLRIVVLPTAAARGRPGLAGANGVAALEAIAQRAGIEAEVEVVPVLDAASAADADLAARIAGADLIHLPGGDPDLLPRILPGSAALVALTAAFDRGACIAGASAGAMALADPCWTPDGLVPGLGFVRGMVVVPHADAAGWARLRERFGRERPAQVGLLGLAERTGVVGRPGEPWLVSGEGEVRWLAPGRDHREEPVVARPGDELALV